MTPRETFIYILVALLKDQTVMALDVNRRTAILEELRKAYCPTLSDADWGELAREIDQLKPKLSMSLMKLMKRNDLDKIGWALVERFEKRNY